MPALSFKKQFIQSILSERKTQTIRNFRKRPIIPGDHLYLYTAMRTKQCEKIGEAVCADVMGITITKKGISFKGKANTRYTHTNSPTFLDEFAKQDGFDNWEHMRKWWTLTHELPFKGEIIYWKNFIAHA